MLPNVTCMAMSSSSTPFSSSTADSWLSDSSIIAGGARYREGLKSAAGSWDGSIVSGIGQGLVLGIICSKTHAIRLLPVKSWCKRAAKKNRDIPFLRIDMPRGCSLDSFLLLHVPSDTIQAQLNSRNES